MIHRFARDESGMTMALAIMTVLLIGVMGAGLLTFVQNDVKSVIEANKGQRAFNIADAGVQAAKAHLRVDSFREHYDTDSANDCLVGWRVGNTNWSKDDESWTSALNPGRCDGLEDSVLAANPADDPDTPWPEQYGFTTCFPDSDCNAPGTGRFHVTIECYDEQPAEDTDPNTPSTPSACVGGVPGDPPDDILASETKFFKITSTGYDSGAGDGAVRKIEAIYTTAKRTYAPIAYWTPKNIDFNGTKCVERISAFAGGSITGVISGQGCPENNSTATPRGIIANRADDPLGAVDLEDRALYSDWNHPPYNTTPRVDDGPRVIVPNPIVGAGFGAVGHVCGRTNLSSCIANANESVADGYQDYDSTTGVSGRTCALGNATACATRGIQFVGEPTDPENQSASEITFPFEENEALTDPTTVVDPELVQEMMKTADDQKNLHDARGETCWTIGEATGGCGNSPWPAEGDDSIVYVVDGGEPGVDPGVDVEFRVRSQPDARPKGVIIVRNGNLSGANMGGSNNSGFEGVLIIIGDGDAAQNGTLNDGRYTQGGQFGLDGYVAASGDMTISGSVSPSTSIEFTNLNSFFDVELWSWREVYE